MERVRRHLAEAMKRVKTRHVVLEDEDDDIELVLSSDSDEEPVVVDGDEFFTPGR
jgi:hypothetical protein